MSTPPAATGARRPLQGVGNVIRFNWHFYLIALLAIGVLLISAALLPAPWTWLPALAAASAFLTILVSTAATALAYDFSPLYRLDAIRRWIPSKGSAANIHAGFDEVGPILAQQFPEIDWQHYDFYDPERHTEVSIQRARRAHPPDPAHRKLDTRQPDLPEQGFDLILLFLAAHEIRDDAERAALFRALAASLRPGGRIIVVEHLREGPNFLAYNIGTLHFHSRRTWERTFREAGLEVAADTRAAPLIQAFKLLPITP